MSRQCLWLDGIPQDTPGTFTPALLTEGDPGYQMMNGNHGTRGWHWECSRKQAVAQVERVNRNLFHISPADAAEIFESTMIAQIREGSGQGRYRRHRPDTRALKPSGRGYLPPLS